MAKTVAGEVWIFFNIKYDKGTHESMISPLTIWKFLIMPVALTESESGLESASTNVTTKIIRRKREEYCGGSTNQIDNNWSDMINTGKEMINSSKNENFELRHINACIYDRSPLAYDFTICGLIAIWKFWAIWLMAACIWTETPLAAFTTGPKNTLY